MVPQPRRRVRTAARARVGCLRQRPDGGARRRGSSPTISGAGGSGHRRLPDGPVHNTFDLRETFSFPTSAAQFVTLQQRQGRDVPAGNQVFERPPIPTINWYQFGVDIQQQLRGHMVVKLGYKRIARRESRAERRSEHRGARERRRRLCRSSAPRRPCRIRATARCWSWRPTRSRFYNALLLEVTKRFSGGVHFQGAYTFSKLIDEASGIRTSGDGIDGAGAGPSFVPVPTLDRGLSTFHVGHNFVGNMGVICHSAQIAASSLSDSPTRCSAAGRSTAS